jgi:hypothetical protein
LESPSEENHIRFNLDEKGKKLLSASSESEDKKIFFETISLAEIYIEQGYISTALEIYRRMQKRDPSDQQIKDRISALEVHLSQRRGIRIKEPVNRIKGSSYHEK